MVLRGLRSSAFRFQRAIPHLFVIWKSEGALILYISNCLLWTQWTMRFPVAPNLDCWRTHSSLRKLILRDCSELLFHREGLPSNLRELEICRCNQLTSQVDWDLHRLTSLTKLTIKGGCEYVELFPKECLLPSSLTCISISDLPNLKSLDSRGLQRLASLLQLDIRNCPELQFPTGSELQHLISLKIFRIYLCPRLQSLTEAGLHHLATLETLYIVNCPKLQYLTKERLPDSLSYLYVYKCPSLEQQHQFEKGQEWRYISHIPKIEIDDVLF